MFCSKLSMLTNSYSSEIVNKIDAWLSRLSPYARSVITVSKLASGVSIEYKVAQSILEKMAESGILQRRFAVKCPECETQTAVIQQEQLADYLAEEYCCYSCDYTGMLAINNIEVVYAFDKTCGDTNGINFNAHPVNKDRVGIDDAKATEVDNLLYFLNNTGFNFHNILYAPSTEQYSKLKAMLELVQKQPATRKEKGDRLENFICSLFNACRVFHATELKTENNQLDCAVKIDCTGLNNSVLQYMGNVIVIECKNEQSPPSVGYVQKLHDIVAVANGSTGIVRVGLLCCMQGAPKTFTSYAHRYYLSDKTFIIPFCLSDYENLVYNKYNLLDLLNDKIVQLALDATQPLGITV